MTLRIAIIGRPNVGKSTLFNRLVGKKLALVDDTPGVTRDRREGDAGLGDLDFIVIDTAGLDEGEGDDLATRMNRQTEVAIEEADAIFFVIDARAGVTPVDRHFAALVRRADKPVILVANKAEGKKGLEGAYDAYTLGLGDPVPLSAEHDEGFSDLYQTMLERLPENLTRPADETPDERAPVLLGEDEDGTELDTSKPLRVAVAGRPNAGKSTLLNRILGQDRLLVGPEAGVTRDSISVETEWKGRKLKLFDTAGLRKRARVDSKLEKLAAADALRAVRFAEVVIVLLDATIALEKQDLTIASLVEREGRALVIGINKWDLVEDRNARLKELREEADRLLPHLRGVEIAPVSGLTGEGIDRLMHAVMRADAVWNKRVATSKLNRWLGETIDRTPPPAVSGRRIKIRYMTQPNARPPTFLLFGNQLDELPGSYVRFLSSGIRKTFDLPGTPIRIQFRMSQNPYDRKKRR